jgi:hypothetical protein
MYLGEPQRRYGRFGKQKQTKKSPCQETKNDTSAVQAVAQLLRHTSYSGCNPEQNNLIL